MKWPKTGEFSGGTRGAFVRSVITLVGGTAIGQIVAVAASPLLTRLYSPSDFGVIAIYGSLLAMPGALASLRYEAAIPLPAEDEQAANIVGLSVLLVLSWVILAFLGVTLYPDEIVGLTNAPGLRPYLVYLPISLLGVGLYQVLSHWALRKKAYRALAGTKIRQSLGQVCTQLILGLFHAGQTGLVIGEVVGRVSGSGTLAWAMWIESREVLKHISWATLWRVAIRYKRFPVFSSWSTLLNSVGMQIPTLLLGVSYGSEVVGWLMLSQRIMGIPLTLVGNAIAQVYLAESASLIHSAPHMVAKLFWQTLKRLIILGTLLVGGSALVGPWAFAFVFGSGWAESGAYVQILTPLFALQFIASPFGGTLGILERQDLHLLREILRVAIMAGAVVLAQVFRQSTSGALLFLSLGGALGYMVYIWLSWSAIRQAVGLARVSD